MAMSRIFSQSLSRSSLRPPAALISHHRHRSSKIHNAQIIEVEIDQASSSQTDSSEAAAEVITLGIKSSRTPSTASLCAALHRIGCLSSRGTPIGGERNRGLQLDLLSEDENMAFTSARGWPASAFYIEGTSPVHPIPVVEVEITVLDNEDQSDSTSDSEDAEG
ncbi:hypothetical protein DH2020_039650 [Rehmannia glutinosa]|uniref:Uncharacterized protein n=1 Tax=Rehmannia glutinosa TaxID=99300 RepID=A0ABR0UV81_REHGL